MTLLALAAIICSLGLIGFYAVDFPGGGWRYHLDTDVYRQGAQALIDGRSLYEAGYQTWYGELPFTYPPFAAVLFSPLAPLSDLGAGLVMTILNAVLVVVLVVLCSRDIPYLWLRALALPLVLLTQPVWKTFWMGQINLLLIVLVLVDVLLIKSAFRGVLSGVAAAMKLTPMIFILVFLARRDWVSAARMLAGAALATAIGWVIAPADSVLYWSSLSDHASRVGDVGYSENQSIYGSLARLGFDSRVLWLLLALAVTAVLWVLLRRKQDPLAQVGLTGVAACLISPVSWSHHWVWWIPLLAVLVIWGHHRLAAFCLLILVAAPFNYLPSGDGQEYHWLWWQHLLGASYSLLALLVVGVLLWAYRTAQTQQAKPAVLEAAPTPRPAQTPPGSHDPLPGTSSPLKHKHPHKDAP